ncbi:hypothetical protein GOP47_0014168 [Adiantum capillus-veneris]|uniref:Fungal lipase-type domain-containing protein n=1 Tax=Adiantum capillus-veneris TaxID=13818 RepID=A0A9D4ZF95_ADICA|nr:hypothetical protein GOP47_0014168 [Adiantum capillus-veneris]
MPPFAPRSSDMASLRRFAMTHSTSMSIPCIVGAASTSEGHLFEKVDKGKCGYEVTKYLYATSKLDLPKFFRRSEREEEKRWSCDSNWIGYDSNWIGYVTVCVDEEEIRRIGRRDIVIAWRGTVTKTEWAEVLRALQTPANVEQKDGAAKISALAARAGADGPRGSQSARNGENLSEIVKVESGFLSLYSSSKPTSRFNKLSAGQQMAMEVKRLLQKYEEEEVSITITGHSLGAALALLCAYDIAANVTPSLNLAASASPTTAAGSDPRVAAPLSGRGDASPTPTTNMAESLDLAAKSAGVMITVFAFAGPRVGNRAWQRRMEDVGVRVLRLVNVRDCVPKVPGFLFNERWAADAPSIR